MMMLQKLGIQQLVIDLPFRLDHVNCFLAEGENGYVAIDAGLHDQRAERVWQEVLQYQKLNDLIITHLHPDHIGYAGILQQLTGANVSMSKTDAQLMQDIWTEEAIPKVQADYERSAVPEKVAEDIYTILRNFNTVVTPFPTVNYYLQEGETIQFGTELYEVIFTPGHSDGLVCFYSRDKRILLSTDHILPKITPNISYWFYGEKNPLQSYENSLHKIKQLDAHFVIPSHGEPFYDANKRIDEIWKHHLQRFDIVLDTLQQSKTIFEVCEVMFPRKLSSYDYQFAIGEAIAHLEYLRAKGECNRELQRGKWVYYKK